jgi:hypothetical protein
MQLGKLTGNEINSNKYVLLLHHLFKNITLTRFNSFQDISCRYGNNRKVDEALLTGHWVPVLGRIIVLASSGVSTPLILHCLTLKMEAVESFKMPVTIMGQQRLYLR